MDESRVGHGTCRAILAERDFDHARLRRCDPKKRRALPRRHLDGNHRTRHSSIGEHVGGSWSRVFP
jgi:hypothetical protein